MHLILETIDGPGLGRRIVLYPGQKATVGRTELADYSFPDNSEMSSKHFQVSCGDQEGTVHDLESLNGILLNGERIQNAVLQHGDMIAIGKMVLEVHIEAEAGEPPREGPRETQPEAMSAGPTSGTVPIASGVEELSPLLAESGFALCSVPETCQRIDQLGDPAKALVQDDLTPRQYVEMLQKNDFTSDAIRFLAFALCKRDAVSWAGRCLREMCEDLPEPDTEALDIAQQWVDEPTESNRRRAEAVAKKLEHATAASWVASGAFFSEGSMGPPETPAVPPPSHLTAHSVSGAIMLAAVAKEPEKAPVRLRRCVELGLEAGEK